MQHHKTKNVLYPRCFVIGDLHVTPDFLQKGGYETLKFIGDSAKTTTPDFIVLLGDLLDDHNKVDVLCHKAVYNLITELSCVAHTYIIIGNHDYIDGKQHLTDNHIFNPYKKWDSITIVDYPMLTVHKGKTFAFCPYVPEGKLISSLGELSREGDVWEFADAVFAHTDPLSPLDKWDNSYPPIITGHRHDSYTKGKIYMCGSVRNVNFGDLGEKYLWIFRFSNSGVGFKKIPVPNQTKKVVEVTVSAFVGDSDALSNLDSNTKLKITGTRTEISEIKKSKNYSELVKSGVKISPVINEKYIRHNLSKETFSETLKNVVSTKSKNIQDTYSGLWG